MTHIYPIREDGLLVAESLDEYPSYVFFEDVNSRMEEKRLSSLELSRRCIVSHTMVDKWRSGRGVPKGKERLKELGMALGMNAAEINEFLFRNGYSPLHSRNPYDSAARLLLRDDAGRSDIVLIYREMIKRLGLEKISPGHPQERQLTLSAAMSLELNNLSQSRSIDLWFEKHAGDFSAGEKDIVLGKQLVELLLLYMGEASVQEMYVSGELPIVLRNLLYPLLAGRTVAVKNLREKLIAFGLYCNMTDEEIDNVLNLAKLRGIGEPADTADAAILLSVRMGHEHYPLYEYENLRRIEERLQNAEISEELKLDFQQRLELSQSLVEYYYRHEKTGEEKAFEECYTSYSDRGLMDYVHDILKILIDEQLINSDEINRLLEYTSRDEEGKSIWN